MQKVDSDVRISGQQVLPYQAKELTILFLQWPISCHWAAHKQEEKAYISPALKPVKVIQKKTRKTQGGIHIPLPLEQGPGALAPVEG